MVAPHFLLLLLFLLTPETVIVVLPDKFSSLWLTEVRIRRKNLKNKKETKQNTNLIKIYIKKHYRVNIAEKNYYY